MSENYYFDGDPATESARRHLERVLTEPTRHRRWPWVAAALVGAAAWYFWPRGTGRSDSQHKRGEGGHDKVASAASDSPVS